MKKLFGVLALLVSHAVLADTCTVVGTVTWPVGSTQQLPCTVAGAINSAGSGSGGGGGGTVTQGPQGSSASPWFTQQIGALPTGGNTIGVIGNTAFGISGTLPAYAATPTFNLGTLNGAATAANQPALGTAGTPSADVISIQGVAGGIAQSVSNAGTFAVQDTAPIVGGNTAPVSITNSLGSSTMTSTQVSTSTTATQIAAADTGFVFRQIRNDPSNTVTIYFGTTSGVTTATGQPLKPGDAQVLSQYPGVIYAISASGAPVVDYLRY